MRLFEQRRRHRAGASGQGAQAIAPGDGPRRSVVRSVSRPAQRDRSGIRGRAFVLLAAIWLLGLIALGLIIQFERKLDQTRRAQVVIAQMRSEQSALLQIAFNPLTATTTGKPSATQTAVQLRASKGVLDASVARLAGLGNSTAPARIAQLSDRYYGFIERISALITAGRSAEAVRELGQSDTPIGVGAAFNAELDRADLSYGAKAAHSRTVATFGTLAVIVFLLSAFSLAFGRVMRARRHSHSDAMTDALTGLGNRRKLFADLGRTNGATSESAIAIFDLDGFKAYNDTFGHLAGDALLTRLSVRLAATVSNRGSAYRIGGDEFVVTGPASESALLMANARAALSEDGPGFSIGCSLGTASLGDGITLEAALHSADQRLYAVKRTSHAERGSEAKDALLQVLAEQNTLLVTHLGHVAVLARNTAIVLGLPPDQVELTRLAAELHDIGKAAIPDSILNKAGPLTDAERAFMERHSAIGERIVSAAPTLEVIAETIRSAHERPDGTGYPDGLHGDQIPISSRIIAVVDAYDAMTSDRPYRPAMPAAAALAELREHAGTQFAPDVVEAFTITLAAVDHEDRSRSRS